MWGLVGGVITESGMFRKYGAAADIASPALSVHELFILPGYSRHWVSVMQMITRSVLSIVVRFQVGHLRWELGCLVQGVARLKTPAYQLKVKWKTSWIGQNKTKMVLEYVKRKKWSSRLSEARSFTRSMDCIERVTELNCSECIWAWLNFGRHISALVTKCNQRLF